MKVGPTFRTKASACTACGAPFTAASGVGNDDHPRPGSISVCIRCAHVMIYAAKGKVRNPTAGELAEIADNPEVKAAVWAVKSLRKVQPS